MPGPVSDSMDNFIPDIDTLTYPEIRKLIRRLDADSRRLGEVKATLIVNCLPGRPLHDLGLEYDESKSVIANLGDILGQLVSKIGEKDGQ